MKINRNSWHYKKVEASINKQNQKTFNQLDYWKPYNPKKIPNDLKGYLRELRDAYLTNEIKAIGWAIIALGLISYNLPTPLLLGFIVMLGAVSSGFIMASVLDFNEKKIKPKLNQFKEKFKIKLIFE